MILTRIISYLSTWGQSPNLRFSGTRVSIFRPVHAGLLRPGTAGRWETAPSLPARKAAARVESVEWLARGPRGFDAAVCRSSALTPYIMPPSAPPPSPPLSCMFSGE
jgi:hypothetical protein